MMAVKWRPPPAQISRQILDVDPQLNHPARSIRLRSARAFLNSAFTWGHVPASHRVPNITRIRSETRSQGCCQLRPDSQAMLKTYSGLGRRVKCHLFDTGTVSSQVRTSFVATHLSLLTPTSISPTLWSIWFQSWSLLSLRYAAPASCGLVPAA